MALFDKKNIIKIEEEDISDAKLSSIDFKDESIKKRAFINVLGARLAIKMLFSKKIEANNVYSSYTIHNFLEEIDIADIYVQGIKIDVRLVFDQNEIFIPKTHFEYDLIPDLYLVLLLKEDFSCVEPLGFFEPKDLDKTKQNQDFYFFEHENLNNIKDLKTFIKNNSINDYPEISEKDFTQAEELFLSLTDKEISNNDKLFLFRQLNNSVTLREKFVEFENFEIISKETANNGDLLQDGVLDIVAAQQVFEDEGANATQAEIKAEVIGEVLSDLLLEENTIEEATEREPKPKTEEDQNFINELLGESSDNESENEKGEGIGNLAAGMTIGGAIVGGISAAAAAESALESTLGSSIIESGLNAVSSGIDFASDLVENASEERPETNNAQDELFDLDDLGFTTLDEDTQVEIPELKQESEQDEDTEQIQEQDLSLDLDQNLFKELESEAKDETTLSNEPEFFGIEESITSLEETEAELDETQYENIEEPINEISEISIEEDKETNVEDEGSETPEDSEINNIVTSLPNIDEMIIEGTFDFESIKEKVDEVLFEDKPNFEAYGINEEDLSGNVPDYVSQSEENLEPVDVESKEPIKITEDNLIADINTSEDFGPLHETTVESLHTIDEVSIETMRENESIGSLPELDLNIFSEPQEEKTVKEEESIKEIEVAEPAARQEESEEEEEEEEESTTKAVFNLDDFDFNILSDGTEVLDDSYQEQSSKSDKPIIDDDFDYESIERQIEEEEEKIKEKEKLANEPDTYFEEETQDDFLAQVDDFLKDIDLSEEEISNIDLSSIEIPGVDKTLMDNPIAAFDQDQMLDTSAFISSTGSSDDETLQLLFKDKDGEDTEETEKEILPSIRKDKKMVVAASIASVVLVSLVIGGGIINNNNSKMANNLTTSPVTQQNQPQDAIDQSADQNLDLSQQVPDSGASSVDQQPIPGENQQMDTNRDMGQAVSDAFTSEPVNATISKIAWEVPEDLAYNDGIRSYLQIAGKNLKLNLQNNLLLATEMAYSNKVVVNVVISGDGSLQSSRVATSSGSKQIDNIVLQSVKETLMYLKMPSSELRGKSVGATLIINF